jgi:hypothetical protein
MEFKENYRSNWKNHFFECPTQEAHSKFSVTNQKDEDLWEEPSNTGTRP